MAVEFLTDAWMGAITDACRAHQGYMSAIASMDLTLQFHVTDVPERNQVDYYLQIGGGDSQLVGGTDDTADAAVTNTYETAVLISKGDLNTQMAFVTGKIKLTGDMGKVMMAQGALGQFALAAATVDVDYPG